jgi:Arc/MetJ-type ribon-helix-helix transcriptional regulator
MTAEGFRGISIKKSLADEAEQFIRKSKRYKSIAEFVSEAMRLRLEQLKPREA